MSVLHGRHCGVGGAQVDAHDLLARSHFGSGSDLRTEGLGDVGLPPAAACPSQGPALLARVFRRVDAATAPAAVAAAAPTVKALPCDPTDRLKKSAMAVLESWSILDFCLKFTMGSSPPASGDAATSR